MIPPCSYVEPELFRTEQQQLFNQHWWLVGPAEKLTETGNFISTTLFGLPIFVVRNKQGELRGYHNVCRHRAGPMVTESEGRCKGQLLVCRYHGWSYDFNGCLRNAHSLNDEIDHEQFSLYPIRVDQWNGLIFVAIDNSAPALLTWLGNIPDIASHFQPVDTMEHHGLLEKKGKTNWKCYGDNACEGYHVSMVHRGLNATMQQDQIEISTHDNGQFIGFDVTYSPTEDEPTRMGKGYWIYKFPGLLLHFADYAFNAETVIPVTVDGVDIKRWFWINQDEAKTRGVEADALIESASQIMNEDLEIL